GAEPPPPGFRIGLRVIEEPAPQAVAVEVLLPVAARGPERGVRVLLAPARRARAHPPLERQRLAQLESEAAAEMREPPEAGGHGRIAPQEQPLRAGPHPPEDPVTAVLR